MFQLVKYSSIFKVDAVKLKNREKLSCIAYSKSNIRKLYDKIKREKHLSFYNDIIDYKYQETLKVCDPYLEMKYQKDCEKIWDELVMLNKLKYGLIAELKDDELN